MNQSSKKQKSESKHTIHEFQILAFLSYVPLLCFITFFSWDKLNEFSREHAKQGIILLIFEIIALLFLIDFISKVFWLLILLVCLAISIFGMIKVAMKQEFKIPFVSDLMKKYDI